MTGWHGSQAQNIDCIINVYRNSLMESGPISANLSNLSRIIDKAWQPSNGYQGNKVSDIGKFHSHAKYEDTNYCVAGCVMEDV